MTHPHHTPVVEHHKRSREEIAKIEIGHTDSSPAKNWALTLFFIAVITAIPLLQNLREFAAIRAGKEMPTGGVRISISVAGEPERSLPQSWDVFSFLLPSRSEWRSISDGKDGTLSAILDVNRRMLRDIGSYESDLKDRDVLMQWLIPQMQIPVTGWLRGGNEDAYCGRDGWLFYRRDIDLLTSRGFLDPAVMRRRAAGGNELKAPPQPDPIKAIVDFRDQLAARGITLVLMPMPVKPSIYPEHHSRRYEGKSLVVQNPSFELFLSQLKEAGVSVFDPAPLLADAKAQTPDLLYLKTDTHWTPAGMERTADRLAAFVRSAVALPPALEGRFTTLEKSIENMGDVALMLKLPAGQKAFAPETVRIRQVLDGKSFWKPDPNAKVLFLGDSFANIFSLAPMGWGEAAGLAEHLSLALGLPVDVISRNDAGSYATRERLAKDLHRGNDRLAGKQVVVWEFAARELAFGDWKMLPLVLGEKTASEFYVPEAERTVAVRAVVQAASPAPRPGSVPYKDHIVMLHLAELESSDDPAAAGKEAVVFAWSMRDNVQTPAARYRTGDAVTMRLRPWADIAQKYEAINRSELEEDDLLMADPCWEETEP